jgi:acyl transferase domain-containing protein
VEAYLKPQSITREPRRHQPELFLLSSSSASSIKGQVERHQEFAKASTSVDLTDMAYTLAARRAHMPYRTFTVWDGTNFVETTSQTKIPSLPPSPTLIFTRQGAQWPEMAKDLIMANELFKDDLCRLDSVLQRVAHAPNWSIVGS